MYSLFENPKTRKSKTLTAAHAVLADFEKLLPDFQKESDDKKIGVETKKRATEDRRDRVVASREQYQKSLQPSTLRSSNASSIADIDQNQEPADEALESIDNRIQTIEQEIQDQALKIEKIQRQETALTSNIARLRQLIDTAYTQRRAFHANWDHESHRVVTEMTYLIYKIFHDLKIHEVPASIIHYRQAERAELPAGWRYDSLSMTIKTAGFWIGCVLMASMFFALLLPSGGQVFMLTLGLTATVSITINRLLVESYFRPSLEKYTDKLICRLLGKFEDIGAIEKPSAENESAVSPKIDNAASKVTFYQAAKGDKAIEKVLNESSRLGFCRRT